MGLLSARQASSSTTTILARAMSNLEKYQTELIEHGMAVGALKFGTFTLKSGRSVCFQV